ncbi:hypothetical protein CerSpe_226640 [Prunus speciosa]
MDGYLSIPRTVGRTSTRRKPIQVELESSQPLTQSRRRARRAVSEEMDQEKTEVPKTPAAPNTRRRAQLLLFAHRRRKWGVGLVWEDSGVFLEIVKI